VSVMGIAEVLPHLPRLLRLRRDLRERIIAAKPDVFVGIDSPDFNLPIARRARAAKVPAVQYVSPQVWAWRQSRVADIGVATDLVLCVLPFEADFYAEHGVSAKFVGHPLADAIEFRSDRDTARAQIGASCDMPLIAILPGSRRSEASRLSRPFAETARWLQDRRPALRFAVAIANDSVRAIFERETAGLTFDSPPLLVDRKARDVIAAADAVLTASGTATLETLLIKRPMVVAHKISPMTYWLVRQRGLSQLKNFSLPNLLAGRPIVPEYVQESVVPEVLGPALLDILDGKRIAPDWREQFDNIHRSMRCDASVSAAKAILALQHARPSTT
jgi:lipid-A-disaccharide synthase